MYVTGVPSTTLVAFMLRWMLVFEQRDSDTIWLLKAAPRRFYELDKKHPALAVQPTLSVSAAPTRFGQVSFSVGSSSNTTKGTAGHNLQMVCNVSILLHGRGMIDEGGGISLQVRLRDPRGVRRLSHASVSSVNGGSGGGVTVGKIDAEAETVEVVISASVVQHVRLVAKKAQQEGNRHRAGPTVFSLTALLE